MSRDHPALLFSLPLSKVARVVCVAAAALLHSGVSFAEPAFARLFKSQYGYSPSCNACHTDGGGTPANAYGEQFKQRQMNAAALAAIESLDADGDGHGNGDEIRARANPGSRRSTPSDPGDWLDTANLIPREVQAAFPGVRTYKPLDAIFTESEFARAAALGVELTAADENTIYIPVKDRKPVGTAILVPAAYQGRQFFVLLTTDRQLTVQSASALHNQAVPEVDNPALWAGFVGVNVDKLTVPDGDGAATAVAAGVKKAGTILFVRLKKG